MHGMDESLRRAFCNTNYLFDTPDGELLLQVDRESPALCRLLATTSRSSAAAITAWNPRGQQLDELCNRRAQQELEKELSALSLHCFPGRHEDPAGLWPTEFSTLVLGLSLEEARRIAARYAQLAILWADDRGIPQLIRIDTDRI
jgi:hypothetical protein